MSGRRLNALVVDDALFRDPCAMLSTTDISLCTLLSGDDTKDVQEQFHVSSIKDVISILGKKTSVTTPELLLIYARFDQDPGKIPIPYFEEGDPRGILYGAILAAFFRCDQAKRPFGFAIYSQDLGSISNNSYGMTFFALLKAMTGEGDFNHHYWKKLGAEIECFNQGMKPHHAIESALRRYRQSLEHVVQDEFIVPDYVSFRAARNAMIVYANGGDAPEEDLTVSWHTSHGTVENILLSSLMADFRRGGGWNPDARGGLLDAVRTFDKVIEQDGTSSKRMIAVSEYIYNILSENSERFVEEPFSTGDVGENNLRRLLSFLIMTAVMDCRAKWEGKNKVSSASDICKELRWTSKSDPEKAEMKQIHRSLQLCIDPKATSAKLLETLRAAAHWPKDLPAAMRIPVRNFLIDMRKSGRCAGYEDVCKQEYWPSWLK